MCEQCLVDEHEGNHVLAGQCVGASILLSILKCRTIIELWGKLRIALHKGSDLHKCTTLRVEFEVLGRQEENIGFLSFQELRGKPLRIVLAAYAAHVNDTNARMPLLELFNRPINDGIRFALRHAPIAARKDADGQDGAAALYQPCDKERNNEAHEKDESDFSLRVNLTHPRPPSSARVRSARPRVQAVCGRADSALRVLC